MPSDIKECSLYSFTLNGVKTKTTPKDITARALAQEAKELAQSSQGALDATQMAAVNSGITAAKVAAYDAISVPSAYTGNPAMDGTASPGSAETWARGDHVHPHDTSKQDALTTNQMAAVNSGVTAAKVAAWDAIEVPTKISDLTNDSGFITAAAIPAVPTKTSDLQNDSGFVTSAAIPDSTSDLTNDSGFITANDIPAIPSKTSDLQNDSGFITASAIPDSTSDLTNDSGFITASDIPAIPSKTSELTNDAGFITGYTETDPTVPTWAKQATKPTYTASEVGALPDTTVIPTVPTDVSAFNNDAGYLTGYTETDPTVPAWAKAASKPTYTASEVGAQEELSTSQMAAVNSGITAALVANIQDVETGGFTVGSASYISSVSGAWVRIGSIVVFSVSYTMTKAVSSGLANAISGFPEPLDGAVTVIAKQSRSDTNMRYLVIEGTKGGLSLAHSASTTYHASGAYITGGS